jgi:hypothetical protein
MKIQEIVISCDEFLYACIIEICFQSTEAVFDRLLHSVNVTHICAAQKLHEVGEQVKSACNQVQTVGRMGKSPSTSAINRLSLFSGQPLYTKVVCCSSGALNSASAYVTTPK